MTSIAPPAHTRGQHTTDDWITPRWLVDRLGPFDLDPCASESQPWPCAARSFTQADEGLLQPWEGLVWCNPPYGRSTEAWLNRMALHGNGIALIFARTETRMFFKFIWPIARCLLFLRGRITFSYPDGSGSKPGHNSGGPSVLIAFGQAAGIRLASNADLGALVILRR